MQYFAKGNDIIEPTIEVINSLVMSVLSDKLERDSDTIFIKTIDVKSMSAGSYFVRIMNRDRVLVKKYLRN